MRRWFMFGEKRRSKAEEREREEEKKEGRK